MLVILAVTAGIKILIAVIKLAHNRAIDRATITITPSAPYDPHMLDTPTISLTRSQSLSADTVQELDRLNQQMEFTIRDRTHSINAAINLYQLMGSDNEETTQNILDAYLLEAMEMEDLSYNEVNIQ